MSDGKPKGYLAKYGGRLIDKGYEIIPIRRGSKAPPFDKWSDVRADRKLLQSWLDGTATVTVGEHKRKYDGSRDGVGILTRKTPAADLDIPDADMAKRMEDFITENFGFAPVRVGNAPKRLLLFRTDDPFSKVQSAAFLDPFDDQLDDKGKPIVRKVEILGEGQQFVAFARHPDTGQPYEWTTRETPATVAADDLPELTEEDAHRIVAEFERLAEEAGWERRRGSSLTTTRREAKTGEIDYDDPFAADASIVEIDEAELERKLMLVPGADEYDVWLQIGMALYHQYGGEHRGLELWHQWSEQASNYERDVLDDKWSTFDISTKGRAPVTARLILKLSKTAEEEEQREQLEEAKDDLSKATDLSNLKIICDRIKHIEFDALVRNQLVGLVKDRFKAITNQQLPVTTAREMVRYQSPEKKTPPKWLEGWVYCEFDETFYCLTDRRSLSTTAFNHAHSRYLLTRQEKLEGKSAPEQAPSQVALNLYEIPVVHDRRYMPGEDDLFWLNGLPYVNTYDGRNVPELPDALTKADRRNVARIEKHFEHLFIHERDRRTLIDALAWIVQNPGDRLNWAILIQGTEGDGKTFFFRLLARVLGLENVSTIGAQAVEEKFTSWAEGSQLVFIEEIRLHGHNRYDVLNRLKPLITNAMVPIRRMNVDTYMVPNTVNYILTTNYRDALPLNDNDSRYYVLFSRFQTKEDLEAFKAAEPTYYDKLHEAVADSPGAIRKWLLEWQISPSFKPQGRAPESVAKSEMVNLAKTDEQEALETILATSPRVDMTTVLLNVTDLAEEFEKLDVGLPYGKAMNSLLLTCGFTRLGKVWMGDRSVLFWSKRPERFMSGGKVIGEKVRKWCAEEL